MAEFEYTMFAKLHLDFNLNRELFNYEWTESSPASDIVRNKFMDMDLATLNLYDLTMHLYEIASYKVLFNECNTYI